MRRAAWAALLVFATVLSGQEPALERRAFRAYQERDWAEAARLYEAFHTAGGGTPATYDNLGVAYASLGEWNRAAAALGQAIELDPRHRWAYNHLGFVHREQGHLDLAVGEFRRQIEISPQDPYAWRNLAGTLVLLGRLDEAEKAAEETEKRGYERGAVYIDMACNLHAQRKPEQARKYLERAETLGAERSLVAQEWAHHYLTIGNYRGAEQEYRKLIEYKPYDTARVLHLAALYYETGNIEKAVALLAKVMEVSDLGLVTLQTSANTSRTVTLEELRRDSRAGTAVVGDLPVDLGKLAMLVRLAKLRPAARRASYEEFVAAGSPAAAEAWARENLGWLLFESGETEAALAQLRRAAGLAPERRLTAYRLGAALERAGQTEEALSFYTRSLMPLTANQIDCDCERPDVAARERQARSLYARLHGSAARFESYRAGLLNKRP